MQGLISYLVKGLYEILLDVIFTVHY